LLEIIRVYKKLDTCLTNDHPVISIMSSDCQSCIRTLVVIKTYLPGSGSLL